MKKGCVACKHPAWSHLSVLLSGLTLGCWWQSSGKLKGAISPIWSRRHKRVRRSGSGGWPARATRRARRSALLRCGSACKAWCHNLGFNKGFEEREKDHQSKNTGWDCIEWLKIIIIIIIREIWFLLCCFGILIMCAGVLVDQTIKGERKKKKTRSHPEA